MRLFTLLLSLLLVGCSTVAVRDTIDPKPLSEQKIVAKVRVRYQKGLAGAHETRFNLRHAFVLLEKELNIKFEVVEEGVFEFQEPHFDAGLPVELVHNLTVMIKGSACGDTHVDDGAATICIFQETITPRLSEDTGIVLGAQSGPIVILSNLDNPVAFVNVARHELGHLLGAQHTEDLMAPGLGEVGLQKILPFPESAIQEIRKKMGIQKVWKNACTYYT